MKLQSFARHLKGKAFQAQLHRARRKSLARVLTEETSLIGQRKTGRLPSFLGAGKSGRRDVAERHESLLWVRRPRPLPAV